MFTKYVHIENLHQCDKLLDKIRLAHFDNPEIKYGCFRKIDGSNVQLEIDQDGHFKAGSRNQELDLQKEDFNGLRHVLERDKLEVKIRAMKHGYSVTQGIDEDKFSFIVFGELYGGLYRHPDVQRDKDAQRIQGRIDYSPSNHWIAFDAVAVLQDGTEKWLDLDLLSKLCSENAVDYQIEDFSGTLDECLAFSPVFIDDTGHRLFGLPIIENNFAEGVVIKPYVYLEVGALHQRVIIKNKNPRYKERIKATKAATKAAGANLLPLEAEWLGKLCEFMNDSRAMSAKSKLGSNAEFGEIMQEATRDAISEFKETYGDEFERLQRENDPKDFSEKKITKAFAKYAIPFVKKAYLGE